MKVITDLHKKAIQMFILGRWSEADATHQIADELGISRRSVYRWRADEVFQAEYKRQLAIYQHNFDDIRLAERKERVRVLNDLFFSLQGDKTTHARLKMAILEQIAKEMGEWDSSIRVDMTHTLVGVNAPPRASNYEEWVQQNQVMQHRLPAGEEPRVTAWEETTERETVTD